MKKFVLRVLAAMMVAAMMVPAMGTASVALAAEEPVALNINERVFVSGEAPADNADGSITFSGQKSMKCSFALPETLAAGNSVTVNVKLQFDSAEDAGVRFYLIANGTDVNIATEIATLANESLGTVVEKTFTLTASADATELLFASSGWGVNIDNVTIYEITLGEKPVAEQTVTEQPKEETPAVEITGDEYVVKSGDTLGAIARACGLTVKDLADANNIENADFIAKGTKLVIPAIDTTKRHIVVAGDTLSEIAKKYGCTLAELVTANGIENADFIKVDQLIVLP